MEAEVPEEVKVVVANVVVRHLTMPRLWQSHDDVVGGTELWGGFGAVMVHNVDQMNK